MKFSNIYQILVVFTIGLVVFACEMPKSVNQKGEIASDFEFTTLDGKKTSLYSEINSENIVILNFFASWCAPCKNEAPLLQEIHENYKDKKIKLIAVSVQDTMENTKHFLAKYNLTFPVTFDHNDRLLDLYKIRAIPETYIINKKGEIEYFKLGPINKKDFIKELRLSMAASNLLE